MLYFGRGHQVCCVAWQAVYGITKKTLSKAWKTMKSDVCQIEPQISSLRSKKTDTAVTWIKLFTNLLVTGCQMVTHWTRGKRKKDYAQSIVTRVLHMKNSYVRPNYQPYVIVDYRKL